jgi:hypothetical protein
MEYGRSIRKDPEQAKAAWGKVIDVAGVGTGCTLIKREVLEQIEFRTDEMHPDVHHDWVFAYDLQQKGFVQRCDMSVVCGHISMTPFPRILWPDPDAPRMYRNDFLEKIKTLPDGSLVMEIGALGDYDMNQSDLQPAQA